MKRTCVLFVLSACLAQYSYSAPDTPEPKQSMEWFARAADMMNPRMPGAAPFHMTVKFHAFAGDQMLGPKEKSDFIIGDGLYQETWVDPHRWRREISLGSYHAVEVEGNGVRKFQSSSDYEPSRVLMLLSQLTTPIPRGFTTREFPYGRGWKIDHVATGDIKLVRLSKTTGGESANYTTAYYFYPSGALAMRNEEGLIVTIGQYAAFAGKLVPRSIFLRAVRSEDPLLTADISIQPAENTDAALFDMPGGAADPSMTLRPLSGAEVRFPSQSGMMAPIRSNNMGPRMAFSLAGVLDRHGRLRELEVLLAANAADLPAMMQEMRDQKIKPATIDGSPCEIQMFSQTR